MKRNKELENGEGILKSIIRGKWVKQLENEEVIFKSIIRGKGMNNNVV